MEQVNVYIICNGVHVITTLILIGIATFTITLIIQVYEHSTFNTYNTYTYMLVLI